MKDWGICVPEGVTFYDPIFSVILERKSLAEKRVEERGRRETRRERERERECLAVTQGPWRGIRRETQGGLWTRQQESSKDLDLVVSRVGFCDLLDSEVGLRTEASIQGLELMGSQEEKTKKTWGLLRTLALCGNITAWCRVSVSKQYPERPYLKPYHFTFMNSFNGGSSRDSLKMSGNKSIFLQKAKERSC